MARNSNVFDEKVIPSKTILQYRLQSFAEGLQESPSSSVSQINNRSSRESPNNKHSHSISESTVGHPEQQDDVTSHFYCEKVPERGKIIRHHREKQLSEKKKEEPGHEVVKRLTSDEYEKNYLRHSVKRIIGQRLSISSCGYTSFGKYSSIILLVVLEHGYMFFYYYYYIFILKQSF